MPLSIKKYLTYLSLSFYLSLTISKAIYLYLDLDANCTCPIIHHRSLFSSFFRVPLETPYISENAQTTVTSLSCEKTRNISFISFLLCRDESEQHTSVDNFSHSICKLRQSWLHTLHVKFAYYPSKFPQGNKTASTVIG